jgi:hypothetical protein
MTVHTQAARGPAPGRHSLLPPRFVVEHICALSPMMPLKVSPCLAPVCPCMGLKPLGDCCSGERKGKDAGVSIHGLPISSGSLERFA